MPSEVAFRGVLQGISTSLSDWSVRSPHLMPMSSVALKTVRSDPGESGFRVGSGFHCHVCNIPAKGIIISISKLAISNLAASLCGTVLHCCMTDSRR